MKSFELKTPVKASRINRTRARAWALQVHYQWDVVNRDGNLSDMFEKILSTRKVSVARIPYINRIVSGLDTHGKSIDGSLNAVLKNWRLDRLSVIDRSVLRIAALEILYFNDIPYKVAILEGVRLAELYGGIESPKFVNGVLDALVPRVK
jgi:N utilization substance protein B